MEEQFRECVNEAREGGATVLLSSHILAQVEALCERVSIIRLGRTVESGDRKSTRLNSSHIQKSRMPSSA